MTDEGELVGTCEKRFEAQAAALTQITNRGLPLLKGTIRVVGEEIETVGDFPAVGRSLRARLDALIKRVATLGDIGTAPSKKRETYATILAFAAKGHEHG